MVEGSGGEVSAGGERIPRTVRADIGVPCKTGTGVVVIHGDEDGDDDDDDEAWEDPKCSFFS